MAVTPQARRPRVWQTVMVAILIALVAATLGWCVRHYMTLWTPDAYVGELERFRQGVGPDKFDRTAVEIFLFNGPTRAPHRTYRPLELPEYIAAPDLAAAGLRPGDVDTYLTTQVNSPSGNQFGSFLFTVTFYLDKAGKVLKYRVDVGEDGVIRSTYYPP